MGTDNNVGRAGLLALSFYIALTASAAALVTNTTDERLPWLGFF
jgi:hypothetical protein